MPLQPHEYQDVIQKHCMEARQVLLNTSVPGPRAAASHNGKAGRSRQEAGSPQILCPLPPEPQPVSSLLLLLPAPPRLPAPASQPCPHREGAPPSPSASLRPCGGSTVQLSDARSDKQPQGAKLRGCQSPRQFLFLQMHAGLCPEKVPCQTMVIPPALGVTIRGSARISSSWPTGAAQ